MLQAAILSQNHMIFQKDKKISVWGVSDADKKVTVSVQGKTENTVTDFLDICDPVVTFHGMGK